MKSHIQTCVAYFSFALCCSLCLFSLCLCCLCICSLFLYLPFFSSLCPPFFYLCVPLCIYREIPKKLFPYFLSTDQLMEQFASVFLSTTPNFVFSRAHYSAFLSFYSFRPTLNSLISTGDISTFQLFGLTFLVFWLCHFPFPISLFCFTCLVFIFSFS